MYHIRCWLLMPQDNQQSRITLLRYVSERAIFVQINLFLRKEKHKCLKILFKVLLEEHANV